MTKYRIRRVPVNGKVLGVDEDAWNYIVEVKWGRGGGWSDAYDANRKKWVHSTIEEAKIYALYHKEGFLVEEYEL